jgi:ribosomal protein L11 methyltransferase
MKDDGIFISSGIINIKEEEVRQALLDNHFKIIDTVYMKDWVSFVAQKDTR